jgi:predicted HicB family RNase H-like nuclease
MHIIQTKLTLRMRKAVDRKAKTEAKRRGKSVSRIVVDLIGKDFARSGLKALDSSEFLAQFNN